MDDQDGPLFSVLIACLNAEVYMAEALESVLSQDHPSFELVVVDGGSIDGTLAIIRDYAGRADGRLTWCSEPDEGVYDAMNRGLGRARGRYVVFLGADDRMAVGALSAVERAAQHHGFPEIICGATRVFGAAEPWIQVARVSRTGTRLPKRPPSTHQSVFASREALVAVGGFDTSFRIAADYEVYLKLVRHGAREVLIDEVLSEFRLGGLSSRSTVATARDYRDVRIAHGANRLREQLVMLKSIVAGAVVGRSRGVHIARRDA